MPAEAAGQFNIHSTSTMPRRTSPRIMERVERGEEIPKKVRMTWQDAGVAYDEGLAIRLRDLIDSEPGLTEKKMFGGLAMLLHGNMAVGVQGDSLVVRTDPAEQARLLAEPGARVFDMTGRPMKGWLLVDPAGYAEDADLRRWVDRGISYARSLPPK